MAAHSCAMGLPMCRDVSALDANRHGATDTAPSRQSRQCVVAGLSLVTRTHQFDMTSVSGRVGVSPTSPELLLGRVPQVTGETSDDDLFDDMLLNDHYDGDLDDDIAETIEEAQLAMATCSARRRPAETSAGRCRPACPPPRPA